MRLLKTPTGVVAVAARRDGAVLVIKAVGDGSRECPDCGTVSNLNKGFYSRHLQDLPIQGSPVRLEILLRRWRCRNNDCTRQSFVERLDKSVAPFARSTRRVSELVRWIGHATGGRTAERILGRLGIAQSDDTVLRLLKREVRDQKEARLRVVGIDDWSWQRGTSYGTIMVDLERRQVVDVLADRSVEAVTQWLERHPRVKIVNRDRCGLYAQAARKGAPQAKQVADRFHLLHNLRTAIEKQLNRTYHPPNKRGKPEALVVNAGPDSHANGRQPELALHRQLAVQGRRSFWLERFAQVKELQREGKGLTAIVRQLGLNSRTVAKWTRMDELPERRRMDPRTSSPRRFEGYLAQRWEEGFRTARHLLPELKKVGYTGSLTHLERLLSEWRRNGRGASIDSFRDIGDGEWSAERLQTPPIAASHLCLKPRGQVTEKEQLKIERLKQVVPGFAVMRELALRFRGLLTGREPRKLDAWLDDAHRCGLYGLRRFAYTVRHDLDAVRNAVVESWSNGQTEGQINRLKMLKRAMYGRAGTTLLRARLLPYHPLPTV